MIVTNHEQKIIHKKSLTLTLTECQLNFIIKGGD